MTARRCLVVLAAATLCAAVSGAGQMRIVVDDFEQPGQVWWEGPRVPVGQKPIGIVHDKARNSKVLRAGVRYTGKPIFISRALREPVPLWKCKAVSFWYRLTTSKLSAEKALICRLRTSPTSFCDYVVATSDTIAPNKWVHAQIDTRRRRNLVNIYRTYFSTAKWMTLRLDGELGTTVAFEFFVDDIEIELDEPGGLDYKPRVTPKKPSLPRRDVLIIKNSAASYYNLEDVVRSLPFETSQRVLKFRGLHFPIFGFPGSRQELMRYSLIVLVDVDPHVIPMEGVQWISDFVASGGGLLFCGGPNTFGHAKDFKKPLADLLPVEVTTQDDLVKVNREPRFASPHFITSGIPPRLGKIAKAHLLRPRQGASSLLDLPPTTPPNWGMYTGGGPGGELLATTDAHSGKFAAQLVTREFYKDPKTAAPLWVSVAAIQGNSGGYSGPAAYRARLSTRYDFSFWLKGDVPSVKVECIGWKTAQAQPEDRQYIKTTVGEFKPEPDWKRYEGSFTTEKDTQRFALAFRVRGNAKTLKLGQRIVVDDVVIRQSGSDEAVNLNGGCEDVASIPVLVVGRFHKGRVAVLNTHPDVADTLEGDFFTSDFYDDLMRQTLRWLLYEEPRTTIAGFTPPPRHVMAGKPVGADVAVKLGTAAKATVTYRCVHDGKETARGEAAIKQGGPPTASFAVAAEAPAHKTTRYELTFEVRDWKGGVQATRTCPLIAHAPLDAEIRFRYGKLAVAPGQRLRFRVLARQWTKDGFVAPQGKLSARVRIVDFADQALNELLPMGLERKEGDWPYAEFLFDMPDASKGAYRLEAELLRGQEVVGACTERFDVVDRLDLSSFYPIISIIGGGGGHQEDPRLVRERVDDLVAHGFNVGAVTGVKSFREWGPEAHRQAMSNYTEAYAQTRDMALIYEYQGYTNIRRDRPVAPCVHAPGYREALRRHVAPYLEVGATVPRLISIKVLDEPHAGPKTMDYCPDCRRAWQQLFASAFQKPDAIAEDDLVGRRRHIEFIRDYVAKGYRIGHELKTEAAAPWDLLLTYCSPAYGRSSDLLRSQEDLLWWSATADRIDFDVYPYFYPVSDKIVFLQAHYCMALMRNVSQHLRKPWGFYVELDDRNYPLQVNPVEASSECALAAVAQGADYLNTFINRTFGTGVQARPARWAHLGETLKQVRAAGPLLTVVKTPPARLGFLFPYTHWQLSRARWEPYYAHQLLLRAFGECDVIHEEIARREGGFKCKALALLQTDYLHGDVANLIVEFVKSGGLLLCDRMPKHNESGGPCGLPPDLFAKPPATAKTVGKGQTILLSEELDAAFAAAVKGDDLEKRGELREMVRKLLFGRGLRPRALADDPEIEVGCREAKDTIVLTAVNHGAMPAESAVMLFNPPFGVSTLMDVKGQAHALERVAEGLRLRLRLPARSGMLLVGHAARPAELQLVMVTPTVRRGGRLRYRVIAQSKDGVLCSGHFVTPLRVTDPRGEARPRYAPAGVTAAGVREIAVPIAVNAPRGTWNIALTDPFSGGVKTGKFTVR